ncbi:ribosome biogenesis GTPase YlqF [Mycoplasma phocoenae]|uniref:Ribosome biogenesis GTPase A n=1 Tax=Mycoplasma phocoenae TaxID=754517 RepID=A0A858U8K2_9MOLU|nr:ribosome biogenesis GTPase YlqF [Mycoplasma phocoenae]QJG67068.1 ribosome biogenesis GTPase YlqF [Mycoplasma phocoenae]
MINWFPGHMKKTFDIIKQKEKLFDVFIIVLDSRCPISSYNYEFDKIAPNKKRIFVFTKIDMTNKNRFQELMKQYNNPKDEILALNLKNAAKSQSQLHKVIKKIYNQKNKINAAKGYKTPPLKIGVLGVPNAGKSTLINILAKSKVAKVRNEAGVTRSEQWINCNNEYMLLDTPGLLWPKFDDQSTAVKLAIIGSIKTESLDQKNLVYESYKLISQFKPDSLTKLGLVPTEDEIKIYDNIIELARKLKHLDKNKQIIINDTYKYLMNYFKNLTDIIYD